MTEPYEPTPAEIHEICLLIQQGWSDAERQRRACQGTAVEGAEIPTIAAAELLGAVRDWKGAN